MAARTRHIAKLVVVSAAALALAGCGGGAATDTSTPPPATPPTTPDANGGLVSDPNADPNAPAIDPATGLPVDGGVGAAITVPNLDGGNVKGGLDSLEGGSDVFHSFGYYGGLVAPKSNDSLDGSGSPNGFGDRGGQPEGGGETDGKRDILPYTQAKIAINGKIFTLAKGNVFPKPDPLFRLTGITEKSAEITLLAGEFSDGSTGVTLNRGDTFSLVNQSESMTYKVKLITTIQQASNDYGMGPLG